MKVRTRVPRGLLRFLAAFAAVAVLGASGLASAQITIEQQNSPGVYRIKASALHSLGITGMDVTVAIVDTGILAGHPEFAGRVLTGYNAFDGSTNVTDGNGHGTHVSGIAGAGKDNPSSKGMFGVAYNVNLLPIKALDNRGRGSGASVAGGIQYAVDQRTSAAVAAALKPFAINLSLGSSGPSSTIEGALRNAVSAGMVVAAAAGNSGAANPDYPARYAREPWALGQIIAVGAVDANDVIASWSNRAGDTKNFYLVAPGTGIYSTYAKYNRRFKAYDATYATLSGTSMATPYVTGAVALLKSGWSALTAPQVAAILFVSATDLGATGIDDIYGNGLLNLERALQPIGTLSFPTSSGSTVTASGTALSASAATGAALQAAGRDGLLQIAGFDSFGRDFEVDLAPTMRRVRPAGNSLTPMLAAVDAAAQRVYSYNGTTLRVAFRSEATRLALGQPVPAPGGLGLGDGGFSISAFDATTGRELLFGMSGMGAQSFGLAGELARRGEAQMTPALANPYFSLASQHLHAGIGLPLGGAVRMKLGVLVSNPPVYTSEGAPQMSVSRQSMSMAEISGELDTVVWSAGIGRLQESDSVLGTTQAGALNFAGSAGTNVASFGVAFSPAARVTLGAQYTMGYTGSVANRADSLVSGYTAGRSEAYAVFAALQDRFRAGDSFSVTLAQPMRMVSGAMQMVVPVGADENGSPLIASRSISLRPEGRETRAEALYISPINRHANWFLGVTVRHQPDHDLTAPREVTIGSGFRTVF